MSEIDDLLRVTVEEAGDAYVEAIASDLVCRDPEAWRRVQVLIARSYVLASLIGMAEVCDECDAWGDDAFDPEPVTVRQAYARRYAWDESKHPRDEDGKFAVTASVSDSHKATIANGVARVRARWPSLTSKVSEVRAGIMPDALAHKSNEALFVNEDAFADLTAIRKDWQSKPGEWPLRIGADGDEERFVESTIVHELGHVIEREILNDDTAFYRKHVQPIMDRFEDEYSDAFPSSYAMEHPSELFAEAIAEAVMGGEREQSALGREIADVVDQFVNRTPKAESRRRYSVATMEIDDDDLALFARGPFIDAVNAFRDRVPRLRENIDMVFREATDVSYAAVRGDMATALDSLANGSSAIAAARHRAFWVSDVDLGTIINLKEVVADVIRGTADDEDVEGLSAIIDRAEFAGARNLTRNRIETIIRTNVSSAHNDGRASALSNPDVKAAIPLVMLMEIQDRRTRGNPDGLYPDHGPHFQMDGYVGTIDDFQQQGIVPPNGYNCRGGMRGVPFPEAFALGLVDDQGIPDAEAIKTYNGARQGFIDSGEYPDDGFAA